jgi:hypothetical protein
MSKEEYEAEVAEVTYSGPYTRDAYIKAVGDRAGRMFAEIVETVFAASGVNIEGSELKIEVRDFGHIYATVTFGAASDRKYWCDVIGVI